MRTFLSVVLSLGLLNACTFAPTPMPNGRGGVANFIQVGGKWMLTYNADGSMALTGDNEISWQHTMQAATALGLGLFDYLTKKVTELTAQLANANLTSIERARIGADLAKYNALLSAEKVKLGIGAGAPLGQVNF